MKTIKNSVGIILLLFVILESFYQSNAALDPDSSEHGVTHTDIKTNCTCGTTNKVTKKIIRGSTTLTNEYPMVAGIVRIGGTIFCGGTIITKRHILTAAHCVISFRPINIGIFVGSNNYEEVRDEQPLLKVQKFMIHNKFSSHAELGRKYDIAIIVMINFIEFNRNVLPACLPTKRLNLERKRIKVLGWGKTEFYKRSEDLRKVDLFIKPIETCLSHNPLIELKDVHQLCSYRYKRDSCTGDSGGPLLWLDNDTNRYTLVGIVSYGNYCAVYPAVNTDVSYFIPWIQSVVSITRMKTCAKVLTNDIMNQLLRL